MASIRNLHPLPFQPSIWGWKHRFSPNLVGFKTELMLIHSEQKLGRKVLLRVSGSSEEVQPTENAPRNTEENGFILDSKTEEDTIGDSGNSEEEQEQPTQIAARNAEEKGVLLDSENLYSKFQGTITSFPPVVWVVKVSTMRKYAAINTKENGFLLDSKDLYSKFQGTISSYPPVDFMMKRYGKSNLLIEICIATAILILAVRARMGKTSKQTNPGSVADLVRRGHLRSDRRGISSTVKYDDPFNNPMVKIGKGNSTVEMCGKVYRLEPITLTQEQQTTHQKRRSRAYQWKRPTVFLKEGDSIPPDVDPETIRWIPANHPFATTVSDIDETLAQTNVYQKHGVPSRIQAEHEALQKKLESLQNDEKLNNLTIDGRNAKLFKLYSEESSGSEPDLDDSASEKTQKKP